ncbi:MAG TPA: universal stress protein [Usitatibacter sp.]|jgi:nucleotide-binding universal stress UspA family protein|nr:universal stress protein [Usitatibacter sp.]
MKAYKHILVPTDGTPLSLKAAREAAQLAKDLDARVTAVYVTPPWMPPMADESAVLADFAYSEKLYLEAQEKQADSALAKVERTLADAKIPCEKVHANGNQPWETIIKTARAKKCDLIVMASHGRGGLGALILGSETTKVLTHSKTPVLVCR